MALQIIFAAAAVFSAMAMAWYDFRLSDQRRPEHPAHWPLLLPHTLQEGRLYTELGRIYQRRARAHCIRMLVCALAAMVLRG